MTSKITIKKIKAEGRKVSFSVVADGLDFSSSIIVSLRFLKNLGAMAGKRKGDEAERANAVNKLYEVILGEDGYEQLLEWLEENAETVEEEADALESVINQVMEKVVPKAQSSTQKQ